MHVKAYFLYVSSSPCFCSPASLFLVLFLLLLTVPQGGNVVDCGQWRCHGSSSELGDCARGATFVSRWFLLFVSVYFPFLFFLFSYVSISLISFIFALSGPLKISSMSSQKLYYKSSCLFFFSGSPTCPLFSNISLYFCPPPFFFALLFSCTAYWAGYL